MPGAPKASSSRARGSNRTSTSCGRTARNAAASFWRWSRLTATISTSRVRVLAGQGVEDRERHPALGTPAGPQIDQHDFPPEVGQPQPPPAGIAQLDMERVERRCSRVRRSTRVLLCSLTADGFACPERGGAESKGGCARRGCSAQRAAGVRLENRQRADDRDPQATSCDCRSSDRCCHRSRPPMSRAHTKCLTNVIPPH